MSGVEVWGYFAGFLVTLIVCLDIYANWRDGKDEEGKQ